MKTVGILLAGGRSRRFGSPKAFATWNNRYFYEWSYAALESVCDDVVVITREELIPLFPSSLFILTDEQSFQGLGPLAGIYTAMNRLKGDQYIVLPCDMPFITEEVLKNLVRFPLNEDIKAVKQEEIFHPLVSIWNSSLKEKLYQSLIAEKLGVMQFLSTVGTEWIQANQISEEPAIVFQNINKPL
ncbi:molybdenum cofactor guanylyltransferase [Psychrobacillus sp. INOP01]|uniref:molybdenum cofactor guanylyltransferase n=1 Tax=Psychrobacillus sp. INOP01 TaxID=2829187 RepID=UPI001BAB3985|nr:molybdenum cofactor guanylyltransferase [Psychrobacillus sp. INOP01]QUG41514.1 molybdenum cofactor guanylyltransferase [Psychrobacillus sp. INOP01]